MKKIMLLFIIPIVLLFTTSGVVVNQSSSYIVMEVSSKRVLYGENLDQQMLVASTAKILTALTAIEYYNLDEEIQVSKADTLEVGSKVYLVEGEKIKRRDLVYALMLRSANDAASALSSNNSSEFILNMNELAKKIGMKNSVFENASGLDEREYNLSTAYDMALLSSYAANNETFKEISSAHTYTCKTDKMNYTWTNKHKLVNNDSYFIWGKTGYTKKSKRILVSNYLKEDMNVIVVTINKSDDWNFHKIIINSLSGYKFIPVYKQGIYDTKLDVSYYIFIEKDIILPLKEEEIEKIKIKFLLYKTYARLDVYLSDEKICTFDIVVYDKDSVDLELLMDIFNS